MEFLRFNPEETVENNPLESRLNEVARELEGSIDNFYSTAKEFIDGQIEISEEVKERLAKQVEKIKYGLLPIVNRSLSFSADQINQFNEFDVKTNYTMHDTQGRQAIWLTDLGLTLFVKALKDTKEYIDNIKTGM